MFYIVSFRIRENLVESVQKNCYLKTKTTSQKMFKKIPYLQIPKRKVIFIVKTINK